MRHNRGMTDDKRLVLLNEYLSSGKKISVFEREKDLSSGSISRWLRIFASEDKPASPVMRALSMYMKKDPDKEELLREIARLKQEVRSQSLELKRMEMSRDAYERMILLAEERYGIAIRKNSDAK